MTRVGEYAEISTRKFYFSNSNNNNNNNFSSRAFHYSKEIRSLIFLI